MLEMYPIYSNFLRACHEMYEFEVGVVVEEGLGFRRNL